MKQFYVYIMASGRNGTLYVGVTSNLAQRIYQHKNELTPGTTSQYKVKQLVYYEQCDTAELAITREKNLKSWNRAWKISLIEDENPEWVNLSVDL